MGIGKRKVFGKGLGMEGETWYANPSSTQNGWKFARLGQIPFHYGRLIIEVTKY